MIKLPKLPDRTPIKLTIAILADLHRQLGEYAELYREAYGVEEPVIALIPHMLGAFLASDRRFSRARPPKAGEA